MQPLEVAYLRWQYVAFHDCKTTAILLHSLELLQAYQIGVY